MQVTVLGSGAAMPVPDRAQSGLLVERGDATVLVDCGSGVLGRLVEHGPGGERSPVDPTGRAGAAADGDASPPEAAYEALDALLLTHHHLDHVADLLPLLKARWLAGADPLPVVGPPGTVGFVAEQIATLPYLEGRAAADVETIGPDESTTVAGLTVESRETVHSRQCLAYRIRAAAADTPCDGGEGGGDDGDGDEPDRPTLVVSGDTEADPSLAAWADGAALLVHDCSFPDGVDVSNHPTPTALGDALAGHAFGTVLLTHLYPHAHRVGADLADAVAERYDGRVRLARDGLTVEL